MRYHTKEVSALLEVQVWALSTASTAPATTATA